MSLLTNRVKQILEAADLHITVVEVGTDPDVDKAFLPSELTKEELADYDADTWQGKMVRKPMKLRLLHGRRVGLTHKNR
jgi:hypothetical protein